MGNTTIGILGGGQLARMLALAGYPLGLRFRIYDAAPESPAEHVAEFIHGDFADERKLERFAQGLDVVTYEFENVPLATVEFLARHVRVYPPPGALAVAQDRRAEKKLFARLGIPTPRFVSINRLSGCKSAIRRVGLPAVVKTCCGGYDGKGQCILRTDDDIAKLSPEFGGRPLIVESFVQFEREVSILGVRGRDGICSFYPLIQNRHAGGILRESRAPAPFEQADRWRNSVGQVLQDKAENYASGIMRAMQYVGVLAVEFFEADGQFLANEMAPRVHNSGHWTIEGAATSQFENHLRAICGLPLGPTDAIGHSVMFNLIGELPDVQRVLEIRGAHLHLYGKTPRPGRKLGHVTAWTASELETALRTEALRKVIGDCREPQTTAQPRNPQSPKP